MAEDKQTGGRVSVGDLAAALAGYSEDVLFGQVWEDPDPRATAAS
ncbi:hypothetical protein [Streptomyces variegatus]